MKISQKGFIIPLLLVIVAVLLAGGGAYFYTQKNTSENPSVTENVTLPQATSTTPTTNQTTPTIQVKTYTDPQHHFVFSYPADFALSTELTSTQIPSSYSIDCTNPVFGTYLACLYYIGDQTSDGFETIDFEVHVSTSTTAADCTKPLPSFIAGKGPTTEQKTINGITFAYDPIGGASAGHYLSTYQYRTYQTGECYTIALNMGSNIGQSEKGLSSEFSNMMLAKLQSIMSTFKFTQTTPVAQTLNSQTADWKTYANAKYGFEFKYPNNFVKSFEQDLNVTNNIPFTTDFRLSGCFIVEGGGGLNDPKCRVYEVIVKGNKITENGVGVSRTSTQMGGRTAEKLIWSEGDTSWASIQVQYQGQWYIQQLTYPTGSNNEVLNTIVQSFKFTQ